MPTPLKINPIEDKLRPVSINLSPRKSNKPIAQATTIRISKADIFFFLDM